MANLTDNSFAVSSVSDNGFAQFESAQPAALKELPSFIIDNRPNTGEALAPPMALHDASQSQPFTIADAQGRVIAADDSDGLYNITGKGVSDLISRNDAQAAGTYGCSSCGCNQYTVSGWNRSNFVGGRNFSYSDDDGEGDGYDPGDDDGGDDYYPEDDDGGDCPGGGCGPGGGILRFLLGRFGRGGLFGRLMGGGGFSGLFSRGFGFGRF